MENLSELDKEHLLQVVAILQEKLKRKNEQLYRTRLRLSHVKGKLAKMKETVSYQRRRLLELYQ
ncbi:hypothetical protein [Ohtaekwangia koreensis]|nr:hypothetical protein [Ohtaekwangia koreensis]